MRLSFHGIVGIEIEESYPWFETLFCNTMFTEQNAEDYANCKKFITVRYLHKLKPRQSTHVGKGILLIEHGFIDPAYGCQISWENEKTMLIQTSQECNEWLLICMQLMLLSENHSLIHAAALCRDGQAILIPGMSGSGKTPLVAELVRSEGWKLLGDDLLIINPQGEVLSFLKDFVIYAYHKAIFPDLFAHGDGPVAPLSWNSFLRDLVPVVKPMLRTVPSLLAFSRKHNPQSKKISPYRLFAADQLANRAAISEVILLERGESDQETIAETAVQMIASRAVAITLMEVLTHHCWTVLAVCGSAFIDYQLLFVQMYEIFYEAFDQAGTYTMNLPAGLQIDQISKAMIGNMKKNH